MQVLLNSNLPIDVLGRVWELADIDKDGMLDGDEFAVVRKKIKNRNIYQLGDDLMFILHL